jgi:NAD(P)-dependent dehydrogenase (short-subunit alcohol dehydrogenase family)
MKNYMKKFSLIGKIAFITGGSGLLGAEVSKALADAGARVVILDIDIGSGKRVTGAIARRSGKACFEYFDITDIENIGTNIDNLIRKYRQAHIWVNAAYPRTEDWGCSLENIKADSLRKNVDMHLNGYFLCCKSIAGHMKKQNAGSIINFGSIYGVVGPKFSMYKGTGMTMPAVYSAIKGGIVNFTKYFASYYGKYNVRVNCISPGGVFNGQPDLFVKRYEKNVPLGRMASKEDIPGAVIYLSSEAGAYISGHNLMIDGGWSVV